MHALSGAWDELTVIYNTPLTIGAAAGTSTALPAANTWVNVDVTSLVQGNGTVDMAMMTSDGTAVPFSSRQGANPPQLVVEFGGSAGAADSAAINSPAVIPDAATAETGGTQLDIRPPPPSTGRTPMVMACPMPSNS